MDTRMTTKVNSSHLDRRDFVKIVMALLGSIMAAVVGIPIVGYIISPAVKVQKTEDQVSLGPLENFPIGIPTLFTFTRTRVNGWEKTVYSHGVYVLRKDENQIRVFSDICTHLSCRVKWQAQIQDYLCPCHDSHYDIDGNVTKGPPPRPLDQYKYTIEEGNIYIYFMEG